MKKKQVKLYWYFIAPSLKENVTLHNKKSTKIQEIVQYRPWNEIKSEMDWLKACLNRKVFSTWRHHRCVWVTRREGEHAIAGWVSQNACSAWYYGRLEVWSVILFSRAESPIYFIMEEVSDILGCLIMQGSQGECQYFIMDPQFDREPVEGGKI